MCELRSKHCFVKHHAIAHLSLRHGVNITLYVLRDQKIRVTRLIVLQHAFFQWSGTESPAGTPALF